MLRQEVKSGSELGQKIKSLMTCKRNDSSDFLIQIIAGALISDDIVISIVQKSIKTCNKGFMLDGFPRTLNQAKKVKVETL